MKTIFDTITINYSEYEYFKQLPKSDQIEYFFQTYDAALFKITGMDLSSFFSMINPKPEESKVNSVDIPDDADRVDVLIDQNHIMLESNSLRAVKYTIGQFIDNGYILRRDLQTEKFFRKDKVTKYIRIYKIVDQTASICLN